MVIQFGYITLFAAAFPLGSFLSLIFNLSEVISDGFKISKLTRRPITTLTTDIGIWKYVLYTMSMLSVITNTIIFTYTSNQFAYICPWLFKFDVDFDGHVESKLRKGEGRYIVTIFFIIQYIF